MGAIDHVQSWLMNGSGDIADVFGAEELATVAMQAARRYIAEMERHGGVPPGANAAAAARSHALAMLRSAAWLIQNEEADADQEPELDDDDADPEFVGEDDD